jgi:energy-coupling factor transporter ATP-binding protein EcfA2
MWLQIIWFLARAPRDAAVVLDEPDVYMHPDLQRRLLGLVRERFQQLLIATHSVEIISDVDPRSIVAIDRHQTESQFVTSLPGLQEVMDDIGSVQNVQLMRLMGAESVYLVEGDDVKILRILQATAKPQDHPIDLIPHADLGGRGGWGGGVPSRLPKANAEGDKIRSFALLDRDYFPDAEVKERYAEARSWHIQLRVWARKELENYLLVPEAISRHIYAGGGAQVAAPTAAEVTREIDRIVEMLRDSIQDSVATLLHARDKKGVITKANKAAREIVKSRWRTRKDRWSTASGKKVISELSRWSQSEYGIGFGPEQLARALAPEEVDPEVVEVLSAISEGRPLRRPFALPR